MEGAAEFSERFLVFKVGRPLGEILSDRVAHLARLFDEDFKNFFVKVVVIVAF